MPILAALAAVLLLGAAADPPEVLLLRNYLRVYQQSFAAVVADEVTVQTVTRGRSQAGARITRGEFFTTFIASDGIWMSVHDVIDVDGAAVNDRPDLGALFSSGRIRDVGPAIARSNARFNIGSIARNFNEPTLALQLFAPARSDDVSFTRERRDRVPSGETLVTLGFRLRDGAPFISSLGGRRVTTRGSTVIGADTGSVRQTTLTIDNGDVRAVLETAYALEARLGLWLPVRFNESYSRRDERTTAETTFSNYRRFEGAGRLIP